MYEWRQSRPDGETCEAWIWTTGHGVEHITVRWQAYQRRWYWDEGDYPLSASELYETREEAVKAAEKHYLDQIKWAQVALVELRAEEAKQIKNTARST